MSAGCGVWLTDTGFNNGYEISSFVRFAREDCLSDCELQRGCNAATYGNYMCTLHTVAESDSGTLESNQEAFRICEPGMYELFLCHHFLVN